MSNSQDLVATVDFLTQWKSEAGFFELLFRELWLGGREAKVLIQGSAPDRLSAFHVVALLP